MSTTPAEQQDRLLVETSAGKYPSESIVTVRGPMTIRNFFEFQDLTRKDDSQLLIIDLAGVPYMDSAALGALLGVHVSRERKQKKYAVVNVCDRLHKMFEISGVQGILVTFASIQAAEAALAG